MPTLPSIRTSIENSQSLVIDSFARKGLFRRDKRGRLVAYTGGFSVVYPFEYNNEVWAFRCWHADLGNLRGHFFTLSAALSKLNLPYFCSFTYVDEGHLLSIRGNVEGNEDISKIKALTKLIEKSEGFYVFSATPNKEITKLVNEYNGDNVSGLMPIYTKTPYDAIQEGRIVAPKFVLVRTNKSYITEKMVSHVFDIHKSRTSKIPYHKLLVCCNSFAHIEVLSKLLNEHYKSNDVLIFATDSKNGQRCITTGNKYYDVNDFTHDIDSSTQDCIVLHIRQMTAGIDVSSFTGTVKFVTDITTKYTSITQTVGRCVRLGEFIKNGVTYKEDRMLAITDPVRIASRLKDFGDNYIIVPDDYTQADNDLRRYIQIYWGIGYGHITKYHYKESTKKDDVLENEMNNTSNDTEEAEEESCSMDIT